MHRRYSFLNVSVYLEKVWRTKIGFSGLPLKVVAFHGSGCSLIELMILSDLGKLDLFEIVIGRIGILLKNGLFSY